MVPGGRETGWLSETENLASPLGPGTPGSVMRETTCQSLDHLQGHSFHFLKDNTCSQLDSSLVLSLESQNSPYRPSLCPISIPFWPSGQCFFSIIQSLIPLLLRWLIACMSHTCNLFIKCLPGHILGILSRTHKLIFLQYG